MNIRKYTYAPVEEHGAAARRKWAVKCSHNWHYANEWGRFGQEFGLVWAAMVRFFVRIML